LLLELIINESISSTETVSVCDSYTWPLNGQTYTSSGTHTEVLQTQLGCDSTVILNLTILSSNGSQTNITACDNFTWNGQTYAQSGTYSFQTVNIAGCDSIAALNLTIHNSVQTQEIIPVCEWEDENILEFAFTTIHGCDSIHIVIYERYPLSQLPIASFSTSPTTTVLLPPGVIQTFNSSQNSNTYLWNFGDGSATATEINPTHTYQNEGQYEISLVVNNSTNCPDTSVQLIIVQEDLLIYVPNAFTPDGDNFNPQFLPIINGDFDPYNYTLLIFNRWGEVVFESRNAEIGWDGTYGGKIVQDGTYIWKIRLQSKTNDEPKEFVGHVTVLK
jgi:gliding motility-associated-like protein